MSIPVGQGFANLMAHGPLGFVRDSSLGRHSQKMVLGTFPPGLNPEKVSLFLPELFVGIVGAMGGK
jgi:hypothetical protein